VCACLCEWTCNAWPCVGARPHSESWTLDKHPQAYVCRIQQPCPRSRAFPARSAHRTCMHKPRQIRPIAGLARGWILTTRIVGCVLLAPITLPRPQNLPRRRLSSRAEGRQKPKSAPDDVPFRVRWLVPGTLDTLNVHSLASGERWKRPGGKLGGAAAARLVWRCRIWMNGANILGAGRLSSGHGIAQHVPAETREMPPVLRPGHPSVTSPAHEKNKTAGWYSGQDRRAPMEGVSILE
jgi:hypothetical protein